MCCAVFIGVGVQKCASTWVYDILSDHPDVTLSTTKETDFFSYRYGCGFQWYARQFPPGPPRRAMGEISPSYFVGRDVPARIAAFAPDAKILVSLRDPVERALSNHRHEVRLGRFSGPDLSFEAGLANNPMYLEQSRYGTHLLRWRRRFSAGRIRVLFQEDIEADPEVAAREIYRFLEIDPGHVSARLHTRANESHVYRSRHLEGLRRRARGGLRRAGLDLLWRGAQRVGLQGLYRGLNRRPPQSRIPPPAAETCAHLRELLADEIRTVEKLTGRDLSAWLGPPAGAPRAASDGAPTAPQRLAVPAACRGARGNAASTARSAGLEGQR